ncbi:hypothetical protein Q8F55_007850 [Vanrija albida]|uniref:Uncharacterized protein n=1 Tax=Vanrija albida TaxID=181172 RepID=A0ABR3PUP4_9TREE
MRNMIVTIIDEVTKHHDFVSYTQLVEQHIALGGISLPLPPAVGAELARLGNRIQTCDGTSAEVKEEAASWIRRVFALHDGCYPEPRVAPRSSASGSGSGASIQFAPDPAVVALAAQLATQRHEDAAARAESMRLLRALVERVERLQNSVDTFAAATYLHKKAEHRRCLSSAGSGASGGSR